MTIDVRYWLWGMDAEGYHWEVTGKIKANDLNEMLSVALKQGLLEVGRGNTVERTFPLKYDHPTGPYTISRLTFDFDENVDYPME